MPVIAALDPSDSTDLSDARRASAAAFVLRPPKALDTNPLRRNQLLLFPKLARMDA